MSLTEANQAVVGMHLDDQLVDGLATPHWLQRSPEARFHRHRNRSRFNSGDFHDHFPFDSVQLT